MSAAFYVWVVADALVATFFVVALVCYKVAKKRGTLARSKDGYFIALFLSGVSTFLLTMFSIAEQFECKDRLFASMFARTIHVVLQADPGNSSLADLQVGLNGRGKAAGDKIVVIWLAEGSGKIDLRNSRNFTAALPAELRAVNDDDVNGVLLMGRGAVTGGTYWKKTFGGEVERRDATHYIDFRFFDSNMADKVSAEGSYIFAPFVSDHSRLVVVFQGTSLIRFFSRHQTAY